MKVLQVGDINSQYNIQEALERIHNLSTNDILRLDQFTTLSNDYKSSFIEYMLKRFITEYKNDNHYFFCSSSNNNDNIFTDNTRYKKLCIGINIFNKTSRGYIDETIEDIIIDNIITNRNINHVE